MALRAALAALLLVGPPTPVFHLRDPRLDEISGIAVGIRSPGVVYVQNDSGDSARFFALDARTGDLLAEYDVPGARNVDWEDLAVTRDAAGTPSVWLADIGDNASNRTQLQLYRVDEPLVHRGVRGRRVATAAPQVLRLRYPPGSGAHDAESLAVSPAGVPYVITKSLVGRSEVFAVPDPLAYERVQTLRPVGTITFAFTGTPGPFAPLGQLTATGADWQGDTLVVRTYTDAYFWRIPDEALAAALQHDPVRVALPEQPQGEGICLAGDRALIDSERVGSAVYAVPVPPAPSESQPVADAAPTRTGGGSTHRAAGSAGRIAQGTPGLLLVTLALAAATLLGALALAAARPLVELGRAAARRRRRSAPGRYR
jgi:hypothetical protein